MKTQQLLGISYEKLLGDDLYTTFKGQYMNHPVVIKFFTDVSDQNNEYEVLDYLQKHSQKNHLFPKPYFQVEFNSENLTISVGPENQSMNINDVYKVIVYEYLEGFTLCETNYDKNQVFSDIQIQLYELHRLGFVYADLKKDNIIKRPHGQYNLIDFGRTFSLNDQKFPPMEYMIDDNEIPNQDDDFKRLNFFF